MSCQGCSEWAPTAVLPYLAAVPHIDEGTDWVEGARPTGQQVGPVVGVQHTDVVGTVGLGEEQGRERITGGLMPTPSSLPLPGALQQWVSPSPGSLGCTQALCLHPGARGARWQLAPTHRAGTDFI